MASLVNKLTILLIGALNGSGKTTFLQAIDFVLYGKFSNYFYSQKLSYENFLIKNVNKKNLDDIADSVTMTLAWIFIKSGYL